MENPNDQIVRFESFTLTKMQTKTLLITLVHCTTATTGITDKERDLLQVLINLLKQGLNDSK